MAVAAEEESEAQRVEAWRTHVLCKDAHLSIQAALVIAKTDEDLHRVVRAVTGGCSEALALEIFT